MPKKTGKKSGACCSPRKTAVGNCCRVESLLCVDERGQMVLPKNVRDKAGIKPGDKLGLVTWEKNGEICCIVLMKADEMGVMAKNMLAPLVQEIV